MWRADKSLAARNSRRMIVWLGATILLGLVFLVGQGMEWRHLFSEGTNVSTNLFGTTFFTLTGFHGLHVMIGLIALAVLLGFSLAGDYRNGESRAFTVISLYWHFVDVVWVVIFAVVYLWTVCRHDDMGLFLMPGPGSRRS